MLSIDVRASNVLLEKQYGLDKKLRKLVTEAVARGLSYNSDESGRLDFESERIRFFHAPFYPNQGDFSESALVVRIEGEYPATLMGSMKVRLERILGELAEVTGKDGSVAVEFIRLEVVSVS